MGKKQTRKLGLRLRRNKKRTLRNKRPVQKGGSALRILFPLLLASTVQKNSSMPNIPIFDSSKPLVMAPTGGGGGGAVPFSPGSHVPFSPGSHSVPFSPGSGGGAGEGGGAAPFSPRTPVTNEMLKNLVWSSSKPEKDGGRAYAIVGDATPAEIGNRAYIKAMQMVDKYLGDTELDLIGYFQSELGGDAKGQDLPALYKNNPDNFIVASQKLFKGVIGVVEVKEGKDKKLKICVPYHVIVDAMLKEGSGNVKLPELYSIRQKA